MGNETTPAADQSGKIVTVAIETVVKRDGGDLDKLRFRRPVSGDLRGISIAKLGQLDYDELRKLLPRISLDGLVPTEIDALDVADQIEVAGAVTDFLVPKRRMAEFQAT